MEPRNWDVGDVHDVEDEGGRRRPDIIANLANDDEIAIDVVGIWRHLTSFKSRYNAPGAAAVDAERIKNMRYEGALRRLHRTRGIETGIGHWVTLQKRNFYAAWFECTGALGPGMQQLTVCIENSEQRAPTSTTATGRT